jgi:hypothetical protein
MPLWKCNKCHHEWEGDQDRNICDWCNSEGHILEKETAMEKSAKHFKSILERLKKDEKTS